MKYALVYEIGDGPERRDEEEFPDAVSAKVFAAQSLRMKMTMARAGNGSVSVGQVEGPGEGDVEWLGAFDMDAGAEPIWSEDDE